MFVKIDLNEYFKSFTHYESFKSFTHYESFKSFTYELVFQKFLLEYNEIFKRFSLTNFLKDS